MHCQVQRPRRLVAAIAACAVFASLPSHAAAESSWLDVEGQIQYGYYTEDARSLTNLSDRLTHRQEDNNSSEGMRDYYAALTNYRLALIWSERRKNDAVAAGERCVASTDRALEAKRDSPEVLALQSACLGTLAELKSWRAPLAQQKSSSQSQKAVKLAPRNPRVLLVDALIDYDRAPGASKDRERAVGKLKAAVAAFEKERQGVDRAPGWGAAEAYAYLGRGYLDRGEVLAARDALERALLIAPEFVFARRLMSRITSG